MLNMLTLMGTARFEMLKSGYEQHLVLKMSVIYGHFSGKMFKQQFSRLKEAVLTSLKIHL